MVVKEYVLEEDIPVFYIQAETFPEGIPGTFESIRDYRMPG
jgi:hypothetical protein